MRTLWINGSPTVLAHAGSGTKISYYSPVPSLAYQRSWSPALSAYHRPGDVERQIVAFNKRYNYHCYHECIGNVRTLKSEGLLGSYAVQQYPC